MAPPKCAKIFYTAFVPEVSEHSNPKFTSRTWFHCLFEADTEDESHWIARVHDQNHNGEQRRHCAPWYSNETGRLKFLGFYWQLERRSMRVPPPPRSPEEIKASNSARVPRHYLINKLSRVDTWGTPTTTPGDLNLRLEAE